MDAALTEPIIVCPLAIEEQILRKCGVPGRLIRTGPGAAGIARLSDLIGGEQTGPVILAGVAGAIDPSVPFGSAWIISEVVGSGERWQPNWPGEQHSGPMQVASVACSPTVLTTPDAKRRFTGSLPACENGAKLVDQECAPFAKFANERGWRWGIVRGVSDGLETALPPGIETWVDERGRTRLRRVLLSCAAHPMHIGSLISLRRNTLRALRAVADLLRSRL